MGFFIICDYIVFIICDYIVTRFHIHNHEAKQIPDQAGSHSVDL